MSPDGITSGLARLKIKKTFTVHRPIPGIRVNEAMIAWSERSARRRASAGFVQNQFASPWIARTLEVERPTEASAMGLFLATTAGSTAPPNQSFRCAKTLAAALPDML